MVMLTIVLWCGVVWCGVVWCGVWCGGDGGSDGSSTRSLVPLLLMHGRQRQQQQQNIGLDRQAVTMGVQTEC